ncbi:MAG: DUF1700 domain-containing protein [Blautia sp.]|jgi:uncharacterized membrane protein
MTKTEYLNYLSRRLRRLPKEDFDIAMEYFTEYFDEAGPENEQQAIRDLGSPEDAADAIIRDMAYQQLNTPPQEKSLKRNLSTIWIVILAIFASPIALPLAIAGCAVIFSVVIAILSLIASVILVAICMIGASIISVIAGIWLLFTSPINGMAVLGAGLIAVGISILITYAAIWLCKKLFVLLARFFKRLMRKGGKKNGKK